MTAHLPLSTGMDVVLEDADGGGWLAGPQHGLRQVEAGDGAAESLLDLMRERPGSRPAMPAGWDILRLADLPACYGERAMGVDQTNESVVVGEQVVLKWSTHLRDIPHPAVSTAAQLSAAGFTGTPTVFAVLTWSSPRGHVLPVASATRYLPGARDGWEWCVDLVREIGNGSGDPGADADPWTADFPERLGALAADLHIALATPTRVFAHPVQPAGAARVQRWYDAALSMLDRALRESDEESAQGLRAAAEEIARTFDDELGDDEALADTPVMHIHGDLHVGQTLRSPGGLSVVDFDGNPVAAPDPGVLQPAARDVAQLLRSLDHVGRVVLHRAPERDPDLDAAPVLDWLERCRSACLAAYRSRLDEHGLSHLLDERLLAAFELEQELRELVYAAQHLPSWSFAPRASLAALLAAPV